jgi:uncharacterized SAM-binding protein YcdF (DUF218 family)
MMAAAEIMEPAPKPRQKCWGMINRRERWGISARGWLVLFSTVAVLGLAFVFTIHDFLAITERVPADVLVAEGWMNPYGIQGAVNEFKSGHYTKIYTTGGPENGTGVYVNDFQTSASIGADQVVRFGVAQDLVQMVPSHVNGRDRTYNSALALKQWFREHHLNVTALNVVTEDCHARRTRLLFQEAFGDSAKVGIVSVPNTDYDPKRWWHYSEGVRQIISETPSYLYAKFLFWPSPD